MEEKLIATKYTKSQLVASKKYQDKRDVLNALLKETKQYSFSEVETLIENFMKGKVNK